ncbi:MAG: cadherin-like domain-containing protein, partial [Phycisphaerales bacterium]
VTEPVFVEGAGTILNLDGTVTSVYVCALGSPGATLNFDAGAQAAYVYAYAGSHVNLYGGTAHYAVSVQLESNVSVYGASFVVEGDPITHYPGESLSIVAVLTAYDSGGGQLFTGQISCAPGATVTLAAPGGGTNTPPIAVDDSAETELNTEVIIDVLGNDSDPDGDPLTVESVTQGTNGSVANNGDGTVTYTPNANFVGTDTFTYTATDGEADATATVTVTVIPAAITIDIKPGSYPNAINLGSNGVVPVAILSTADFSAPEKVNPENVFLAGSGVAVRGKGSKYLASQEDVNADGLLDLVVKIETENLDPGLFQDGGAYVRVHETSDQTSDVLYEGWDEITIVPPAPPE